MKEMNFLRGKKLSVLLLTLIMGSTIIYMSGKLFTGVINARSDFGRDSRCIYKASRHYNKTFEVSRGKEMFADLTDMNVTVKKSSDNKVHVSANIEIRSNIKEEIPKDYLKFVNSKYFMIKEKEDRHININSYESHHNCKMTIFVPADLFRKINVSTVNGNAEAQGIDSVCSLSSENGSIKCLDVSAKVNVDTENGDIHCTNIAGKIYADTENGDIDGTNIAGKMYANTENGDISFRGTENDINAEATNGDIFVEFSKSNMRRAYLESESGNINVEGLEPQNISLDIRVGDGKLNLSNRYINRIHKKFYNTLKERIGNGKRTLKVSTDNGTVDIN